MAYLYYAVIFSYLKNEPFKKWKYDPIIKKSKYDPETPLLAPEEIPRSEIPRDQVYSAKSGHTIICYFLDTSPLWHICLQTLSLNIWLTHLYFLTVSSDEKKG